MGHRLATVALAVLSAGALAGCGSSSNGLASKSPDAIIHAASNAVAHASSVHVTGSIMASGTPLLLNLSLVAGKGGRGQVTEGGLSFQLVDVGQTVYLYGTPAFWQHYAGAAAAGLIDGRWVKAAAAGPLSSLGSLTNMQALIGGMLTTHGPLSKGPRTTVNGQRVIEIRETAAGGTVYYVATSGQPYPVEIKRPGPDTVQIALDQFNQSVALAPPPNAVDASRLG